MKRTALYCLISGILGGLLAVALSRGPSIEPLRLPKNLVWELRGPVGGPARLPAPPADPRRRRRLRQCLPPIHRKRPNTHPKSGSISGSMSKSIAPS